MINTTDILETINMVKNEHFDVRTITMGISLLDCLSDSVDSTCEKIYDKNNANPVEPGWGISYLKVEEFTDDIKRSKCCEEINQKIAHNYAMYASWYKKEE